MLLPCFHFSNTVAVHAFVFACLVIVLAELWFACFPCSLCPLCRLVAGSLCRADVLNKGVVHSRRCGFRGCSRCLVAGSLWGLFRVTTSFYYQFARRTNGPGALFIPRPPFRRGRCNGTNYLWIG